MTQHLFVYGTLRRAVGHSMGQVLAKYAEYAGPATFRGRLYRIADYPGAVPSEDPADRVFGEVHGLIDPAVLAELDAYEGIGPDFPQPTEYVRHLETVSLADGRQVRAWVYLYNRPVTALELIANGNFLSG